MKTTMKIRLLSLLAMALLFPATLCGQKLHRYVVEVVTEPVERVVKVEKLINGDSRVVPQGRRRTVSYYEIISRTPLTLAQCNDSIRLGRARLVPNPRRSRKVEEDLTLTTRKNMTMDGEEGINPWDVEQTEYDLMYEDPDLYDFIAD